MRITRACVAAVLIVLTATATSGAADNAVVFWNNETAALVVPGRGPAGILDFAKVHAAVHDAVQAYQHRFEPYCGAIPNASGSPSAAVAAAARGVLVALFPAQATNIETTYQSYLDNNGLAGNAGIAIGAAAAACVLALRADDGSFPSPAPTFFGGTNPGEWRSTTSMASPWFGNVKPFALKSPSQLRPAPGPPDLRSGLYTRDYNEVKDLGAINSTLRTVEQAQLAHFYSDNTVGLIQRTLRGIAIAKVDDLGDSARMFALANLSAADALIGAWDTKLFYNFWRPITAIREGEDDGNRHTDGDPGWTPLISTPNYPEYTSGANNLVASIMRSLHHFFGTDRVSFTVQSTAPAAVTGGFNIRTYERFSDMCNDLVDVRVYQGIHFRFGDEVAFRTGSRAADWVFSHILR